MTNNEQQNKKPKMFDDSITMGSAAKGVCLKIYTDITDHTLTEQKIRGMLKAKSFLKELGVEV